MTSPSLVNTRLPQAGIALGRVGCWRLMRTAALGRSTGARVHLVYETMPPTQVNIWLRTEKIQKS